MSQSERDRIRRFVNDSLPGAVSQVTRRVALQVLSGVVQRTPVDTGRARGNWQTSIGRGPTSTTERLDKSGGAAISEGTAVIGGHKDFEQIQMTNNLPYIARLEDGYSKQAPEGMVGLTLAALGLGVSRE